MRFWNLRQARRRRLRQLQRLRQARARAMRRGCGPGGMSRGARRFGSWRPFDWELTGQGPWDFGSGRDWRMAGLRYYDYPEADDLEDEETDQLEGENLEEDDEWIEGAEVTEVEEAEEEQEEPEQAVAPAGKSAVETALFAIFEELQPKDFRKDGTPRMETVRSRLRSRKVKREVNRADIEAAFHQWKKRGKGR
jgi:hypothetical protein